MLEQKVLIPFVDSQIKGKFPQCKTMSWITCWNEHIHFGQNDEAVLETFPKY